RIVAHDAVARLYEGHLAIPFGMHLVDDFVADPGREGFVEPDVVPPGGGDIVAGPNVSELVRRDERIPAFETNRFFFGLAQHRGGAERDQPGVFHRAAFLRHGNVIELLEWIGDVEVVLEAHKDVTRDLRSVRGLRRLALGHDDANRRGLASDLTNI